MDFFVFVSEQWLLVSTLLVLVYVYMWREKAKGGRSVSAHEATRLVNRDEGILVDLRDEAEYKAGHIVDALNRQCCDETSRPFHCQNSNCRVRAVTKLIKGTPELLHSHWLDA